VAHSSRGSGNGSRFWSSPALIALRPTLGVGLLSSFVGRRRAVFLMTTRGRGCEVAAASDDIAAEHRWRTPICNDSIVTHPRIYSPPSSIEQGLDQIAAWMDCPSLVLLAEEGEYWASLEQW
jgi:hypothetical protein